MRIEINGIGIGTILQEATVKPALKNPKHRDPNRKVLWTRKPGQMKDRRQERGGGRTWKQHLEG